MGDISNGTAIEIASDYASEECVGQLGDILDAYKEERGWIVEFRTHTYADSHDHQVEITSTVGNIISHERSSEFD